VRDLTVPSQPPVLELFVVVVGWPGSGKSTLAAALAAEMRLPLLAKTRSRKPSWTA
jgi:adenylate kinase family enzyme